MAELDDLVFQQNDRDFLKRHEKLDKLNGQIL